jgi:hypothetical protein
VGQPTPPNMSEADTPRSPPDTRRPMRRNRPRLHGHGGQEIVGHVRLAVPLGLEPAHGRLDLIVFDARIHTPRCSVPRRRSSVRACGSWSSATLAGVLDSAGTVHPSPCGVEVRHRQVPIERVPLVFHHAE